MLIPRCSNVSLGVLVGVYGLLLSSDAARAHVILDEPNGAEVLDAGSVFTIEWHIQIAHFLLNWDLWYSTTGAAGPWISIVEDLPPGSQAVGSVHTYDWTVPDDPSNQIRVRVRMDNNGKDYFDISNADLTIQAPLCNDDDGDGYGSPGDPSCSKGAEEDCDDTDPDTNPGAAEVCNDFADNDCDGLIDGDDPDCAGPTTHHVTQVGLTFDPADITVSPGDTIEWHWSSGIHTVTSGASCTFDGRFDELHDSNNQLVTYTVPSNEPDGVIPYFCIPHCFADMTGTITVVGPDPAAGHKLLVVLQRFNEVRRYDAASGDFIDTFIEAESGGLDEPTLMELGPNRHLYVTSRGNDRVLRYDGTTGAFMDTFVVEAAGGLDAPSGLRFGPDGNLYVSSSEGDAVLRYDGKTGAFIDVFIATGSGGLDEPYDLVFGPDGNLYVCSGISLEVLRYNGQSGAFMDVFATAPEFDLFEPLSLQFGPDGNLYVTSAHPGKVIRFDGQTGATIDQFVATGAGGLDDPVALAFGPDGHLYVSDFALNDVLRFDGQTGEFIDVFLSVGPAGFLGGRCFGMLFVSPPAGACCDEATGTCVDGVAPADCVDMGFRFGGSGSDCASIDPQCLAPTGACCDDSTGTCSDGITQADCDDLMFRYGGDDSDCTTIDPPCVAPTGACCDESTGTCADGVTQADCNDMGSGYGGDDSDCATIAPPCLMACTLHTDCPDPDVCTFVRCLDGYCVNSPARYGDLAGPEGICGPDGDIELVDILAVLDGFQGDYAKGCGFVDINLAGDEGSCTPNASMDLFDILAVLDAFQGDDACCSGAR